MTTAKIQRSLLTALLLAPLAAIHAAERPNIVFILADDLGWRDTGSLYEGGTRVPLLIVWPGETKAGAISEALFQSVDFYPTLLAMCGLKPQPGCRLTVWINPACCSGSHRGATRSSATILMGMRSEPKAPRTSDFNPAPMFAKAIGSSFGSLATMMMAAIAWNSNTSFLGHPVGKQDQPAKLRFRVRGVAGTGRLVWMPGVNAVATEVKAVAFTMTGEDWQVVTADLPAPRGKTGLMRLYLPAQPGSIEVEWIELVAGEIVRRWDFRPQASNVHATPERSRRPRHESHPPSPCRRAAGTASSVAC